MPASLAIDQVSVYSSPDDSAAFFAIDHLCISGLRDFCLSLPAFNCRSRILSCRSFHLFVFPILFETYAQSIIFFMLRLLSIVSAPSTASVSLHRLAFWLGFSPGSPSGCFDVWTSIPVFYCFTGFNFSANGLFCICIFVSFNQGLSGTISLITGPS